MNFIALYRCTEVLVPSVIRTSSLCRLTRFSSAGEQKTAAFRMRLKPTRIPAADIDHFVACVVIVAA